MTNIPPGWHPDPADSNGSRERYWDGSSWTEQLRDGDATGRLPDPEPTQAVPEPPPAPSGPTSPPEPAPSNSPFGAPTVIGMSLPPVDGPGGRRPGGADAAGPPPQGPPAGAGSDGAAPWTSPAASDAPPPAPGATPAGPPAGYGSGAPPAGQPGYGPGAAPSGQPGGYGSPPPASGGFGSDASSSPGGYPGATPPPPAGPAWGQPAGAPGSSYGSPPPPGGYSAAPPSGAPTPGYGTGAYGSPDQPPFGTPPPPAKKKTGLWLILGGVAALLVLGLIAFAALGLGGGGTTTPTTAAPDTTAAPVTSTSTSTSTSSTSTTVARTTTTTAPRTPSVYADASGKFKFTNPGWEQEAGQEGFTRFKVPSNTTDNLFGGQFEVKSTPNLVLNEKACADRSGTVETITVAGQPTKFCKALADNKLVTVWAGFPPVGSRTNTVTVAYSALLQTDPAKAVMPAEVKAALASFTA